MDARTLLSVMFSGWLRDNFDLHRRCWSNSTYELLRSSASLHLVRRRRVPAVGYALVMPAVGVHALLSTELPLPLAARCARPHQYLGADCSFRLDEGFAHVIGSRYGADAVIVCRGAVHRGNPVLQNQVQNISLKCDHFSSPSRGLESPQSVLVGLSGSPTSCAIHSQTSEFRMFRFLVQFLP